MEQPEELAQVRSDIGALQRQMRQLLEALAVMRQAPPATAAPPPPLPAPLPAAASVIPGTLQAPLQAELHRLIETVRSQAEEVGTLRERVRQLERTPDIAASDFNLDEHAHTLRILLRALRDDAR